MTDVDTSLARLITQLEEATTEDEVDLIEKKIAIVGDLRSKK
jgi:hypothetical protein